jgi:hypothetical protein
MELTFFIILFVSYLGLLLGVIISHFSKEEIKEGKKYFKILKSVIFFVILSLFFVYLKLPYFISIPASVLIALFLFYWERKIEKINAELLYYSFFSVVIYETMNVSPLYAVLIFIYGIPSASLKYEDASLQKNALQAMLNNIIYIILSISFFFFRI